MRIAFYAPLKPPTHPVPSGDRRMARLLMAALARANHRVELASRFRSREGAGDPERQAAIGEIGRHMARRLVRQYLAQPKSARPELWFTYHLYYKAPDWLGPIVAEALDIPYVIAEASHANKRATGAWTVGHEAAAEALARADLIFSLNPADDEGVAKVVRDPTRLIRLKPFLDGADFAAAARRRDIHRAELARRYGLDPQQPWLLTVAMMRDGAKFASYGVLAAALARLADRAWQLVVVGDGPRRPAVEEILALLGANRLRCLGARTMEQLPAYYAAADIYVWPAIDEAYGVALLEAQAAGLPVVAGAAGGVPSIVVDGRTGLLTTPGDGAAFAGAVRTLLDDPARRQAMGRTGMDRIADQHDIAMAAATLDAALRGLPQQRASA